MCKYCTYPTTTWKNADLISKIITIFLLIIFAPILLITIPIIRYVGIFDWEFKESDYCPVLDNYSSEERA